MTWWVSRRRPSWAAAVSPPPSPPPPRPPPLPPRLPLPPTAAATLFVAFALLPIASEGHPCVPLYRVTFGLRAQPNLPGGRPGPPFSTNPGNELRGSRGLLVAMATEPSPNPLNQTPIPYPSALRYPLPPPLPRRARRSRCLSSSPKRVFRYSRAPFFDDVLFFLSSCFFCLLFLAPPPLFFHSLCWIAKCQSSFFGIRVVPSLFSFIIARSCRYLFLLESLRIFVFLVSCLSCLNNILYFSTLNLASLLFFLRFLITSTTFVTSDTSQAYISIRYNVNIIASFLRFLL